MDVDVDGYLAADLAVIGWMDGERGGWACLVPLLFFSSSFAGCLHGRLGLACIPQLGLYLVWMWLVRWGLVFSGPRCFFCVEDRAV